LDAFNERNIYFVAYSITPGTEYYSDDLKLLDTLGFKSVALTEYSSNFPQDGAVVRVDSNKDYEAMGYTAKHPHGAYAIKERKTGKTTVLREVLWQTGKSGRVTPVAIFDPIDWGGATVTRATLNNPGFIQSMQLELGDTIEVVRSGEIIPQVVGKVWD
jgi:NAD-dependent DNA ligase